MNWLKETIKLSKIAHRNQVIADLNIKTATKAVKIKTKTKHHECYIYSWKRQNTTVK